MKCLSRIEMQEFSDKEVSAAIEADIINHLNYCSRCKELLRKVNEDKALINNVLNQIDFKDEKAEIPVFKLPVKKRKRVFLRTIIVAAAAIIAGLIFLVRSEKTTVNEPIPEAEMLIYQFYEGKDLNKMWHDKSQIIILQDEKGNVIQSIITN
jgi:hypothetical protein